jgi:hypothetical protein
MQRETWGPASPLGVRDRRPYPPDEMPRVPPLEVPDVPERLPGPIREVPSEPDEIPGPSPTEVPEPGSLRRAAEAAPTLNGTRSGGSPSTRSRARSA